jgi:SAM-dependent methyltransferase
VVSCEEMSNEESVYHLLQKIRDDWDERARENARYFIVNSQTYWSDEDFFQGGRQTVANEILTDPHNVFQEKDPKRMRVLEIGCGAGRVTRALGELFGEVHAVDVSGEMVRLAREACRRQPHVMIHHNNGVDLSELAPMVGTFDFAFSSCVFQHIPSYEIVESYVKQIGDLLRPGGLFKFEVQGSTKPRLTEDDTWCGVGLSDEAVMELAERCGFEARHRVGAGQESFWLWFFKNKK